MYQKKYNSLRLLIIFHQKNYDAKVYLNFQQYNYPKGYFLQIEASKLIRNAQMNFDVIEILYNFASFYKIVGRATHQPKNKNNYAIT